MRVDPRCRRRGLARRLIQTAAAWAADRGLQELVLHVTSDNPATRAAYEDQGFVPTGKHVPHAREAGLVEYEMLRKL